MQQRISTSAGAEELWNDLLAAKRCRALAVSLEHPSVYSRQGVVMSLASRGRQAIRETLAECKFIPANFMGWERSRQLTSDHSMACLYRLLQMDRLMEPPGPFEPAFSLEEQGLVVAAIAGEIDSRRAEKDGLNGGPHMEQMKLDRLCSLLVALDEGTAVLNGPAPAKIALAEGASPPVCMSCMGPLVCTRFTPPECSALGTRCDVCGLKDLGNSCPYFHYCTKCRFAVCPGCDGVGVEGEPDRVCGALVPRDGRRWRCDTRQFICGGLYPDHAFGSSSCPGADFIRAPSVRNDNPNSVADATLTEALRSSDIALAEKRIQELHEAGLLDELRLGICMAASDIEGCRGLALALHKICAPGFGRDFSKTQAVCSAVISSGVCLDCSRIARRDIMGCPDITAGMRGHLGAQLRVQT
eukprot:gnl/MRDRNA2_/MRDRNA2_109768_c0_seq1.p1 gnl/MRDRNA2_/MRDRNA2_109768_c0~~gnl/MRDRNA2_/MRDRNA2_109768_c0_seq1.p1  ORF type:complete len:414 (-),score=68.00 gnl/MRDRNA2_/MRDRNA2_109768_c0_seq1:145-1386(-)